MNDTARKILTGRLDSARATANAMSESIIRRQEELGEAIAERDHVLAIAADLEEALA